MVILFFERFKRLFENFLPTHRIDHRHLYAGQFNIGRQNIHAFTVTQDCPAHIIRRIHHLRKQPRGEHVLQAVRLRITCADHQTSLWVAIDEQHFLSPLHKPSPKIQAGCSFAYAAFLVAEGSNCCFHFLILLLGMQKAQPFQAALSRLYCYRFKVIHVSVIHFH